MQNNTKDARRKALCAAAAISTICAAVNSENVIMKSKQTKQNEKHRAGQRLGAQCSGRLVMDPFSIQLLVFFVLQAVCGGEQIILKHLRGVLVFHLHHVLCKDVNMCLWGVCQGPQGPNSPRAPIKELIHYFFSNLNYLKLSLLYSIR